MEGIGEIFGQCVDDVVRRPLAVVVPLVQDVALFLLVALAVQGIPELAIGPYHVGDEPAYAFAIPGALPSVGDLFDVPRAIIASESRDLVVAVAAILVATFLLAYLEAGFIGLLKRLHVDPRESRLDPDADLDEPDVRNAKNAFYGNAVARGGALAAYRLTLVTLALVAASLAATFPGVARGLAGVLVVEGILLYAPYALVLDHKGPVAAARRSFRLVSDHLATTLVTLLFLFATTGAVAALLEWLHGFMGPLGIVLGGAVYAFAGTILSLFVLRVYLALDPKRAAPASRASASDLARATD